MPKPSSKLRELPNLETPKDRAGNFCGVVAADGRVCSLLGPTTGHISERVTRT